MIARIWAAKTSAAQAPAYADHFKHKVLAALQNVDGYVGAKLFRREVGDGVELMVITYWHSLDAIKQFAGPELERAVVSEEIIPLLLEYDQRVGHFEVVVNDEGMDFSNNED